MTDAQYLLWFILSAVVVFLLLLLGTLKAADLLPSRRRPDTEARPPRTESEAGRPGDRPDEADHENHEDPTGHGRPRAA